MPTSIPNWLTGTGVTAISVTPLTVNPDGTFSIGTNQPLTGHLDEIVLEQYNRTENITPLDARQDNEAIVSSGTRLTLVEILSKLNGNFLAGIGNGVDYIEAGFSRGGKAFSGAFVVIGYRETVRRGKSVGALTLAPAGTGVTYA